MGEAEWIYGCEECGQGDDGTCLNCGKVIQKEEHSQCDNRKEDSIHSHLNCKHPKLSPKELTEKGVW